MSQQAGNEEISAEKESSGSEKGCLIGSRGQGDAEVSDTKKATENSDLLKISLVKPHSDVTSDHAAM